MPVLYNQCISEQICRFGLYFSDGKGTYNCQSIILKLCSLVKVVDSNFLMYVGFLFVRVVFLFFSFFLFEMVSCGPGWLQTCNVLQDGFEFLILLPSPSVLGLQACANMPGYTNFIWKNMDLFG